MKKQQRKEVSVKIGDLPSGLYSITLLLNNGEKIRVRGKVVEKKGIRNFVAHSSPKSSYGSGTRVLWKRRERRKRREGKGDNN